MEHDQKQHSSTTGASSVIGPSSTLAEIPHVGLGTYLMSNKECRAAVFCALQVGYRLIDTASVYRNEQDVAHAVQQAIEDSIISDRAAVWITSKLKPHDMKNGEAGCRAAALKTLSNLNTPYLDCYIIHWPGRSSARADSSKHRVAREDAWKALEKLHAEKRVKHIGVSNYTVRHLEEMKEYATTVKTPYLNQVELHPLCQQHALREYCRENGIILQAYSSFGSEDGVKQMLAQPVLQQVCKEVGQTVPAVCLKWALQHGIRVIPKSSRAKRIQENWAAATDGRWSLSDAQIRAIDDMRPESQPMVHFCWDPSDIQ